MNTTSCPHDNAVLTCVVFISSGSPVTPGWFRGGVTVDKIHHTTVDNLTDGTAAPAYINSSVTVSNVTTLDDGALYYCGILLFTSNSATLNVVGKCMCHDLMLPFIINVSVA